MSWAFGALESVLPLGVGPAARRSLLRGGRRPAGCFEPGCRRVARWVLTFERLTHAVCGACLPDRMRPPRALRRAGWGHGDPGWPFPAPRPRGRR